MIFNSSVLLLDNRIGDYRMTIATQGYMEGAAFVPPGASLITSPPLTTKLNNSDQYQPQGLGNSSLIPDLQPHQDNQSITHAQYLASTATKAQGWEMMEVSACLGMYTEKSCYGLRDYRDVVIIVEGPGWDDPHLYNSSEASHQILQTVIPEKNPVFISTQCRMFGELQDSTPYCRSDCNSIITNMSTANDNGLFNINNWSQLGELDWFRWKASLYPGSGNSTSFVFERGLKRHNWKWEKSIFKISYCMAEPRLSDCSLAVSKPLFLVLIVSISLKLIICAIIIWTLGPEESLVPPGDVIASFLSSSDDNKYRFNTPTIPVHTMKLITIFWFFLLGAVSVYASTCTASPQGNLDRRFDQSFSRAAQRQCRAAGGSPKGNNNRPACDFRGDVPRNLNRNFQVTVSDNGRNRNVNARWSCRR
ncbi:hypothetical protein CcaCcLH18_12645 [Colletotrichum camelliae]|nr:hypothetical protein CcaCcLH18_12645 [Colletotrichum camelliae]